MLICRSAIRFSGHVHQPRCSTSNAVTTRGTHIIELTETREITPYVHPEDEAD